MEFRELITRHINGNPLGYDSMIGVYIAMPPTANSEIRLGERCFKCGGVLDGKIFLADMVSLIDTMDEYLEGIKDPHDIPAEEIVDYILENFPITPSGKGDEL